MALRRIAVAVATAVVLVGTALIVPSVAAPSTARAAPRLSTLEFGVLRQLNAIRADHGLVALKPSAALTAAAADHTREMGAVGYFAHDSKDGTAFWKRVGRWYPAGGSQYWAVGENLLWASPDVAPATALDQWMASPEHRANILKPEWREVGVSALHVDAAPGDYSGRAVTIVTTDFGVRR
jgi:uncharacterized protein YkwD